MFVFQMFVIFMESNLLFSIIDGAKIALPNTKSQMFFAIFSSKCFVVLARA